MLGSLTIRGTSFVGGGGAAIISGLAAGLPDLVRAGALAVALPLIALATARRSRYRLACTRKIRPLRVPAGQQVSVRLGLRNLARLRTGVLLAEETLPYQLRVQRRFVLDQIEPGGQREIEYQLTCPERGKYDIGPLRVRVADAFGLVEAERSFSSTSTLVVTPRIIALPRASATSAWLGEGTGGMRTISATGDDDAAPRDYRAGDALSRVHWRSTARYGQLMVRREEHQWRNTASVFLDTRRIAHTLAGFEFAVSAAASIGTHLTEEGFEARLITDSGDPGIGGTFGDTLLDMLAVLTPGRGATLRDGIDALARAGGQLIVVAGRLSAEEATALAAARSGTSPGLALIVGRNAASLSGADGDGGGELTDPVAAETANSLRLLAAAGWRAAAVPAPAGLPAAWQRLHQPHLMAARR